MSLYKKPGKPYFVPIIGELVELIERRKDARSIKADSAVSHSSLVFHRGGEPVPEFRRSWASACTKADCKGRLFHDLRRSAARNLIRSGVNKDAARHVGGWKTDSMFSRYNLTTEEDLRDAMQKVMQCSEAESKKSSRLRSDGMAEQISTLIHPACSHLYRYQSPAYLERLKTIILEHELYVPSVSQLNDPTDCKRNRLSSPSMRWRVSCSTATP